MNWKFWKKPKTRLTKLSFEQFEYVLRSTLDALPRQYSMAYDTNRTCMRVWRSNWLGTEYVDIPKWKLDDALPGGYMPVFHLIMEYINELESRLKPPDYQI